MYAIFEEVVGPQPSTTAFTTTKDHQQTSEADDQGVVADCGDPPTEPPDTDNASQYGQSGKSKAKRPTTKNPRSYRLRSTSSSLPRIGGRRRLQSSSSDADDASTTSSSNPLLDTISVLTYDPPDDSDDYYSDVASSAYDPCRPTKEEGDKRDKVVPQGVEGDRDSIGYAGSSSIDSGYKSFCPTPELPDPSFYGTDRTQPYLGFYPDSTQGRGCKPRMGTKVISRQGGPISPTTPLRVDNPGSRRSDASLYDVNLDHLMYLRQSLLSAIQKCESGSKADPVVAKQEKETAVVEKSSFNPVEDQRYTDYSPAKNPGYQKTVRFNTDVKVSTVNSSQPPSDSHSDSNQSSSRSADTTGDSNSRVQSKSILKDPLCANLRTHLETGALDCTLEEEIDSLLYGRAEFYDLESVDEFPCSYVTMIEEKYRSGKPSLAKVRKLKGGKLGDPPPKSPATTENEEAPTSPSPKEEDGKQQKSSNSKDNNPSSSSSTLSISKTAKCRFTEVARCMLEIIEDLQMKKLQPEAAAKETSATSPSTSSVDVSSKPSSESSSLEECSDDKLKDSSKSLLYTSAAEYHVYEEIVYDFVKEQQPAFIKKTPDVPPPLPARPTTMFTKFERPAPPPRKSRCPLKKGAPSSGPPEGGPATVEVRNRPKQRGNLYCLFADRAERRSISRSLEREFRVDNQEDDYGFRKEFVSI